MPWTVTVTDIIPVTPTGMSARPWGIRTPSTASL
jgi:hypothetical protein